MSHRRVLTLLAIASALMTSSLAFADETTIQRSEVPKSVLESVAARYPDAKFTHFAKEVENGKTLYEVVLETGTAHAEVSLSPEGKIVSEETTIALKEVPPAVANGLAGSRYAKAKVVRVERVSAAGKATTFEFLVELSGKKHEIVFDQDGKLARSE